MEVAVQLDWEGVGEVSIGATSLTFPDVPKEPGIYKFVLHHTGRERLYVGEAVNLARRFQHYATPGVSQTTNLRMRDRAIRVGAAGGTMTVFIARNIVIKSGGSFVSPDLDSEFARRFIENAVLVAALADGLDVVNGQGYGPLRHDEILG